MLRKYCPIFYVLSACAIIVLSTTADLSATEAHDSYHRQPVSPGQAAGPQPQQQVQQGAAPAQQGIAPEQASSVLWRSFIWESLPVEQLKGPEPGAISEAYTKNDWKPFFIDSKFELNEGGKLLMGRLQGLENEAIDPKPFNLEDLSISIEKLAQRRSELRVADPNLRDSNADTFGEPEDQALRSPSVPSPASGQAERLKKYKLAFQAAGDTDTKLAVAFVRYAKEVDPLSRDDQIKALTGEITVSSFLKDISSASSQYGTLVSAYSRYKKLAAQGPQQHVNLPSKLRVGESGNHVRDLQKRLHQEGFYSGHITGVYDTETQRALKEFQAAHHIDPDGVIGQKTKEWLNISFQQKADMIAYAMKSMRQSPLRTHERFIRINIPQYMLEYYKDGKVQVTHRVVVGKAGGKKVKFRGRMMGENQTPTLNSSIEQVILNPRWYVSDRIRIEMDGEAKSDPDYFARHGYVQMASLYPWGQPRIFQRPGPKNALGRVKFEFPNVYAVYLHDTPKKSLFQRSRRDFSHGCIRVDKALQLAETLLKDDGSAYAQKIGTIVSGENQTFVKLSQPIPISVEYIPVISNGNGHIVFLGDPYGILKENSNQKG
ncbi:MAG: L,D-transpeptidase family protein [Syntrophobacteraceae bacterium]